MRKGIEKLAFELSLEDLSDTGLTLGQLAEKYDEPLERIMDALDVLKIIRGKPTQFPAVPWDD